MGTDGILCTDSLLEVAGRIERREVSPVEVVEAMLARIERLDHGLHTYVTVCAEQAREAARKAEAEIATGHYRGPLHGVTFAVKDIVQTAGLRTTCGSALFADWSPDDDATVVKRLRDAGAILLGKLRTTEFALYGYPVGWPVPVNPWNADYWSGVSSSGPGAAMAASLCHLAIGTDTAGSIRFPSAANGVVGLKPTYGKVSRAGVFPLAATLDHVGPMTHTIADAAAVLSAIAGSDPLDLTSRAEPTVNYLADLSLGLAGLRIGVDYSLCEKGIDAPLCKAVLTAVEVLRAQGAEVHEVDASGLLAGVESVWMMLAAEAADSHRELFPARAGDYGPVFHDLLDRGRAFPAADYARGVAQRHANVAATRTLFASIDVLVLPATPNANIRCADFPPSTIADFDAFPPLLRVTAPFNLSGAPTVNLPCGFLPDGAPMAVQFAGRHGEEAAILRAARAYELATDWHTRRPPLF